MTIQFPIPSPAERCTSVASVSGGRLALRATRSLSWASSTVPPASLSSRVRLRMNTRLPRHFAVYDAIRLKRPESAREAMHGMIVDSRANIKGRGRARKPAR